MADVAGYDRGDVMPSPSEIALREACELVEDANCGYVSLHPDQLLAVLHSMGWDVVPARPEGEMAVAT